MCKMNRIFSVAFLPFSLLLFEICFWSMSSFLCSASDELNVPYVPYVVVDRDKDQFDYDKLQDSIVRFLESKKSLQDDPATSTTLYEFLRTSTTREEREAMEATSTTFAPVMVKSADTRSIHMADSFPYDFSGAVDASNNHFNNEKSVMLKRASHIRDKTDVTANFKATTFQAHKFTTTSPLPMVTAPVMPRAAEMSGYLPLNRQLNYPNYYYPYNSFMGEGYHQGYSSMPKFTPLRSSSQMYYHQSLGANLTKPEDYVKALEKYHIGDEMKCSLKSSRHVYDGGCVSKKPIVETVCADRCIKYEHGGAQTNNNNNINQPFFYVDNRGDMDKFSNSNKKLSATGDYRKQVVALSCRDGVVRKQKVKLYCKDGTIINNVIRIVDNCLCQAHREKVHTTKRARHVISQKNLKTYSNPNLNSRLKKRSKISMRN